MANLATITTNILADSGIDDINVVVTTGSYANPAWITSLAWTKITGAPANIVTGTGTAGQVAYWSSTSAITGESNLFWDATNDRLGISNASPSVKLDVFLTTGTGYQLVGRFLGGTNANGNAGGIALGSTQTQAGYIYGEQTASNEGALVLGTQRAGAYAEAIRIASNGNLILSSTTVGGGTKTTFNIIENGGVVIDSSEGATARYIEFSTGGTPKMFIAAAGNVGIGTTSPTNYTGYRTLSVNNTSGGVLELKVNDVSALNIFSDSAQSYFYEARNLPIWFATNATERMRITSTGQVGIGFTPSTILTINGGSGAYPTLGTATANALMIGRNDKLIGMFFGYAADGNGWIQQMRTDSATAYNLALQPVGGNVLIGTTTDAGAKLQVSGLSILTNPAGTNYNENIRLPESTGGFASILMGGAVATSGTGVNTWSLIKANSSLSHRFEIRHNTTSHLIIATGGAATFSSLAGTGTRMVVADANGLLSTQAIGSGSITGSGTTNFVPKFTGTSTIGNSAIFENAGNVAIGINSSSTTLRLYSLTEANLRFTSDGAGGDQASIYVQKGDGNGLVFAEENRDFIWRTGATALTGGGGTQVMRLTNGGNLGLGVTPSAWGASIRAIQIGNGASIFNWTGGNLGNVNIGSNNYDDGAGAQRYINSSVAAALYGQSNGQHIWLTAPSGTAGNAISFTQAMTLFANGGLSIGTPVTASAQGLLVVGAGRFGNSVTASTTGASDGFNTGSFIARGAGSDLRYTQIGYDTTGNYGWIQPLEQGTAYRNLILNAAGGNVGIGIIAPTTRLDIGNGTLTLPTLRGRTYTLSNVASANPNFINGTGFNSIPVRVGDIIDLPFSQTRTVTAVTDTQITVDSAWTTSFAGVNVEGRGAIVFQTNNLDRLTIAGTGNVGIGTTSPNIGNRAGAGTLTVRNNSTYAEIEISGSSSSQGGVLSFYGDTTKYAEMTGEFQSSNNGMMIFRTRSSGTVSERMRITASGRVLIGTPPPAESTFQLDVSGTGRFSSTVTATSGVFSSGTTDNILGGGALVMLNYSGYNSSANQSITLGLGLVAAVNNNAAYRYILGVGGDASGQNLTLSSNRRGIADLTILTVNGNNGNVLIGTTTTPTPVSGVAFPLTVSSSAATRIRIDSTNASPNSGVGLYANGVQKFSFAMYGATSDFTIYNDALLAPSLTVKGTNSNVLIGTTDDNGSKLRVAGGIGFFDSGIKTGTLDTGYVAGTWKLGRAVIGTQPSETHQIIVEINGALFVIGAASL